MAPDFEIFHLLKRHGVPFVIVGGHAVNFHGYRRTTEDADIVWKRSRESEAQLFTALTEASAQYIGDDIDPATGIERTYPVTPPYIRANPLMMLWTGQGFLDLFDYIPGFAEANVAELFDSSVESDGFQFASIEWLRRMKRASGRAKDQIDLDELPPE
jgi:hypothetical protein